MYVISLRLQFTNNLIPERREALRGTSPIGKIKDIWRRFKNILRGIMMGIGPIWGISSPDLSSLGLSEQIERPMPIPIFLKLSGTIWQ